MHLNSALIRARFVIPKLVASCMATLLLTAAVAQTPERIPRAPKDRPVSNLWVVYEKGHGVGEAALVKFIQENPGNYTFDDEAMQLFHSHDLPESVIEAMRAKMREQGGAPPQSQSDSANSSGNVPATVVDSSAEILDNDAILRLVKAHISSAVIVRQIHSSRCRFHLDSDSLIALTQAGVPESVLTSMQDAATSAAGSAQARPAESATSTSVQLPPQTAPSGSAPPGASRLSDGHFSNTWYASNQVDKMTGATTRVFNFYSATDGDLESGSKGVIRTVVSCDASGLKFRFVFTSDGPKKIGFKQNPPQQNAFGVGVIPMLYNSMLKHNRPWVALRVGVDQNPVFGATSEGDYLNDASISFSRMSTQDAQKEADSHWDTASKDEQLASILTVMSSMGSFGTESQIFGARDVRFALTLDDGDEEVVTIHPQSAAFRSFTAGCPGKP